MRRAFGAFAFALVSSLAVAGDDLSDLWYDPADPGWGLGVFQQGTIAFVTLFTYDGAGRPAWYVGSNVRSTGINFDPCGSGGFVGTLYAMTGPGFGAPAQPPLAREAGRILLGYHSATRPGCNEDISVRLEIEGRTVDRRLVRQTWSSRILSGRFRGTLVRSSACGVQPAAIDGQIEVSTVAGELEIRIHDGGPPQLGNGCVWRGTHRPMGRYGMLSGTETCNAGDILFTRAFEMLELVVDANGLTAQLAYPLPACPSSARLAGARAYQ